jgi:4,5-dihydroxyphthalate decarboxylase
MPVSTTIRYAGLRYLDRTAALENGEVVAHGATLDLRFTTTAQEALALLHGGEADCAEVPLATLFEPGFTEDYVGLPVFPNRSSTSDSFVGRVAIDSGDRLAALRIGLPTDDATTAAWGRSLVSALIGGASATPVWSEAPAAQLVATVEGGENDLVVVPLGADHGGLVPVLPSHAEREAYAALGREFLPILTAVALRRDIYAAKRWLAESLVDAFAEAKEEGMRRHRYFGAISVGLPWLMSALEGVDERFDGDAYRFGLGANRAVLERFARFAVPDGGVELDIAAPFAPETRALPGLPDTTFYAVPLSRVK